MIKCINRRDLDLDRWNQCIRMSQGGRIYALSHFLDAVCVNGGWEGIVLNDYEAVMPLPINNTIPLFPRVSYPLFAQQLGVFSKELISSSLVEKFISAIPKKYKAIYLQLNDTNEISELANINIKQRNNFVLSLDKSYEQLLKNYSKSLRRNINKAKKEGFQVANLVSADFISFYLNQTPAEEKKKHKIASILNILVPTLVERKEAKIYGVQDAEGDVLAACMITQFKDRATYLLARSSSLGKGKRSMHMILDQVIQNYHETLSFLDFEGSDIESVANFFSSFGAINQPYPIVNYKRFPFNIIS